MMDSTSLNDPSDCLGRTCLKWGTDGELTAQDLSLVMERLAQVDQEVATQYQATPDFQPCPSIS
jgi:hypothetical protein